MNPINSYDKYLQEAFTLCKKEIEAAHPGKVVEIIKATDYKTMVMGIADKTYILYGRADGIVHSSTTKIGIFRLWVQFSSPASQKEVIDFEDRIQLYLFLHNLPVAYVMEYVRYSKKFQNAREIHRNETRIQELLEEVRKTIDAAEFDDISVSTFLKNRGAPTNKESKEEN